MGQVDVVVLMGVLAFRGLTGEKRPVFEEIVFKRLVQKLWNRVEGVNQSAKQATTKYRDPSLRSG
jgi:hypothetical protein